MYNQRQLSITSFKTGQKAHTKPQKTNSPVLIEKLLDQGSDGTLRRLSWSNKEAEFY